MFDHDVQIFKDNRLNDVNFSRYLANKKVIICPAIKIDQKPTLQYLEYLDSLLDSHTVDEVILLGSSQNKFFHHTVESYLPRLTTVTDQTQYHLRHLSVAKKKNQPLRMLQDRWIYQQAIDNLKEVGFWEQPLSDNWKHLLKNKQATKRLMQAGSAQRKIMQKFYLARNKVDPWKMEDLTALAGSQAAKQGGVVNTEGLMLGASMFGMGANFFYFTLYHNKELETLLGAINNHSGKTLKQRGYTKNGKTQN
tara:strand:+ start:107 stop:859 length:753 start_codon:yes stop_codon:yes gene_type:complete